MSILSNAFHSAIKANKHGRVWTNSASKFPNSHLPRDEQTLVPLAWSYSKNMVAVVVSQEAFISFERLITSEIHICYLLITAHCKSEQWTHILLIAEICLAHFHAREALCNDFPTFPQLQYPKADQSVKRVATQSTQAPCLCAMKSIILAHPTVLHFSCPVSTAIEPIGKSLRWRCLNHMCKCSSWKHISLCISQASLVAASLAHCIVLDCGVSMCQRWKYHPKTQCQAAQAVWSLPGDITQSTAHSLEEVVTRADFCISFWLKHVMQVYPSVQR